VLLWDPMSSPYGVALNDFIEGASAWQMWGRLGWQEIKRRYRRTVIGPFWTTLSLGIFIGVLGFVWAGLWGQDPKTYLPFLCAGVISWNLVQANVNDGCVVFVGGEAFIKQLPFPYSMLAWSVVWRNLIIFAHNLVIFGIVVLYASAPLTAASLLVVPSVVLSSLNGVWIAMILGVVCARYRDVQQLVGSLLQIAMFVTPVFYTREQLGPRFEGIVDYNVLYHYVELIRAPLLGRAPPSGAGAWSRSPSSSAGRPPCGSTAAFGDGCRTGSEEADGGFRHRRRRHRRLSDLRVREKLPHGLARAGNRRADPARGA
jgi:homopolymeric O-antigen transport system permease protein